MKKLLLIAIFFCLPAYGSEFSISGLKIGDKILNKNYLGACPLNEKSEQPECLNIFKMAGGDVLVTYYFDGPTFTGASIIFDSDKYSKMVDYFSEQLQQEPQTRKEIKDFDGEVRKNEISTLKLDSGELVIQKYKSWKKGLVYIASLQ